MAKTETQKFNPAVAWGVILLFAIAAAFAIRWLTRPRIEVQVARPTYQDLVSSVPTNGKVEPIHEFQAHAVAPGEVEEVYVGVGDTVKPGQMLVKMDDSEVKSRVAASQLSIANAKVSLASIEDNGTKEELLSMQSELAKAQLQQQQAANDLAALKQLQQKGAASASEVSSAQERLNVATGGLDSLIARGKGRFSNEELRRAHEQMENAKAEQAAALSSYAGADIRSPIAGTVYYVPISKYDYIVTGDQLVDVADLNHVQVRAYFDEPEIGRLAAGQLVKIAWDAKPGKIWHGHVTQAPTTVIAYGQTRSVGECIITVDDARGDLLPNTNVTVTVTTQEDDHVLSVPREALHTDGGYHVFRVLAGRLVQTPVEVGVVNLTRAEITSGLTLQDMVALSARNNADLVNGMLVKPVE
jgi:HlyD family secretion protein